MPKEKMRTVKRFGSKFGLKPRRRLNEIEGGYVGRLQNCTKCGAKKVSRIEAGIWQCAKCKHKFASNAYRVS
ncbi:MAG: 50S ribosomal protein L37ae [Candidatus Altiarchaeota archaeon]|nr:50S ribosomal protein L37ae [Candidatus Altiarchaeota archaeon]